MRYFFGTFALLAWALFAYTFTEANLTGNIVLGGVAAFLTFATAVVIKEQNERND